MDEANQSKGSVAGAVWQGCSLSPDFDGGWLGGLQQDGFPYGLNSVLSRYVEVLISGTSKCDVCK